MAKEEIKDKNLDKEIDKDNVKKKTYTKKKK